jgi:hypothetical protein
LPNLYSRPGNQQKIVIPALAQAASSFILHLMNPGNQKFPVARSTFVTVIAWLLIIAGTFSTLVSLLQNILINVFMPLANMRQTMHDGSDMPPLYRFFIEHIQFFAFLLLLLTSTTLISGIGLLKQKNWARQTAIGLLLTGIVLNIVGVVLQFFVIRSFSGGMVNAPSDLQSGFRLVTTFVMIFGTLTSIGFSVLFGWIARRLHSDDLRREFH